MSALNQLIRDSIGIPEFPNAPSVQGEILDETHLFLNRVPDESKVPISQERIERMYSYIYSLVLKTDKSNMIDDEEFRDTAMDILRAPIDEIAKRFRPKKLGKAQNQKKPNSPLEKRYSTEMFGKELNGAAKENMGSRNDVIRPRSARKGVNLSHPAPNDIQEESNDEEEDESSEGEMETIDLSRKRRKGNEEIGELGGLRVPGDNKKMNGEDPFQRRPSEERKGPMFVHVVQKCKVPVAENRLYQKEFDAKVREYEKMLMEKPHFELE